MFRRQLFALILIFAGLGIVTGLIYVRISRIAKPTAGLRVESIPPSVVFVNNVQVGRTPFEKLFSPGEVAVRLVPESTSSGISAYQTKVRLTNKVYTVIRREFSDTESRTAGETITLNSYSGPQSALSVVTTDPESALVSVDGLSQGFSPINIASIASSEHQIEVSSPGYASRLIQAKTVNGYQLSVNVKLAAISTPPPKITPTVTPALSITPSSFPRPYVVISQTPTGFLRVRSAPNKSASEVGQVKPGETHTFLDESESGGWFQIKLNTEATSSGWISSEYAKLFK